MTQIKAEIVGVSELTDGDWARWRAMQASNPALSSPYFRPEFTQLVGQIAPHSRVSVFHRGGDVVGYFPHQRRGGTVQPLGAPMNDYHGLISHADNSLTLGEVGRGLKAGRVNMTAWVGPAEVGETRRTVQVEFGEGGYDAWYAERRALHGKYLKDKERARRSLETEHGPIRTEHNLRDLALLDTLIDWKRDQYRRTGKHDIFGCGWTADVLRSLIGHNQGGFGASMAGLWAGDRLAALEFSLHADRTWHFWFPAYDPEIARCSPGILLSLDTMQLVAGEGYRTIDYGFEGDRYKNYLCNGSQVVKGAVIRSPGVKAAAKHAAYTALDAVGASRVGHSIRHRWAAIEACEVSPTARFRGAMQAVSSALAKAGAVASAGAAADLTPLASVAMVA